MVGGMSELGTEMRSLESYNPVIKEWTTLASLHTKRAYVGVACLDGCIYAVGGWNEDSGALKTVEKYNIQEVSHWCFMFFFTNYNFSKVNIFLGLKYHVNLHTSL